MQSSLGEPNRTWDATFRLSDGTEKRFPGLPCAPGWTEARWIGFCAIGGNESSLHLDDIALVNHP